jgi:hypothetical protein
VENTQYLRKTHGVEAPASILATNEASESIFSQLIDSKDCEEVGFETVILNTKVYSNAFTGVLSPTANDDEPDDARTVLGSDIVDLPLRPVNTAEVDGRSTSNTTGIRIDSPELRGPIQSLGVTGIIANCSKMYTAQLDGEISFKKFDLVHDVQRFSESRYGGRIIQYSGVLGMLGIERAIWGQFDRANVVLEFKLRHPLKVRTVEAFSSPYDGYVSYSKGEIFTVNVS